jgi:phosphopantothenoylcysteine decarboxylase/phosphopantothenate--cysteine ligase
MTRVTTNANTSLFGKHILLGITGGIAAYKSAELTRRLRDAGAEVQVVMTQAATEFVTPLTFQALSGNPVHTALLDEKAEAGMGHIELARWADAVLIAPASANTIAKLAQGRSDDLLTTLCLATAAPLAFAPAMNHAMWADAATQNNCAVLRQRGVQQFGPASGEQACGESGEGRLLEVDQLVQKLAGMFTSGILQAVRLMITAGPTYEAIDPVRFIGNRSSGLMGFELARAAQEAGADVTLIAGPVHLETPPGVKRIDVESAAQMHDAVMQDLSGQNLFIGTAAVADYRPEHPRDQKIKKSADSLQIKLIRNPDILAEVAASFPRPFVVGFAAETENLQQHAREKLTGKKLDMIAANQVAASDTELNIGFNSDYNALHVLWEDGEQLIPVARKRNIARQLISLIANHYNKQAHAKNTA